MQFLGRQTNDAAAGISASYIYRRLEVTYNCDRKYAAGVNAKEVDLQGGFDV
jgi:hypothetical protein